MSENEKIILNIDKEYLELLKDELARKCVREILKLCDLSLNELKDVKAKTELIRLKDLIKNVIYDNFKDLISNLNSHSNGINIIEFIKWKIGYNNSELTELRFIKNKE